MFNTVDGLARADTVDIVLEFQKGLPAVAAHLLELAAVPPLRLPAEHLALRVLGERKLMLAKKRFPETTITDACCAECFVNFPAIIANVINTNKINKRLRQE